MVCLGELGGVQGTSIPDVDQVVVATRGKLSTVRAPVQTADLASVRSQVSNLVLGDAHVVVEDLAGAGAGCEDVLVPCCEKMLVSVTND